MTASRGRHVSRILGVVVCVAALNCGEAQGPAPGTGSDPEPRLDLPALILSNPSIPGALATTGSRAALVEPVVYASLPPRSVPEGELALFTNMATGAGATVVVGAGGFDPVPIPASAGDSLQLRIQVAGSEGERFFYAKAPPRRSPRVVRTDPSPGRSDVPLNSRILVVFSEPMSSSAITDSAVRIMRESSTVPGSLAFGDGARLSIIFTPAGPLEPATSYSVNLSQALRDLDGEALERPESLSFTTGTPSVPVDASIDSLIRGGPSDGVPAGVVETVFERMTSHSVSSRYRLSRMKLLADSAFQFELYDPQLSAVTYPGRMTRTDSSIEFRFDARSAGSSMLAIGTFSGDTLAISFDAELTAAGLEPGTYSLSQGAIWLPSAAMPAPREWASAIAWNGTAYIIGGLRRYPGQPLPSHQLDIFAFDPVRKTWRTAGRLLHPVDRPGLAVVADKIYVFGDEYFRNDGFGVQVFDPASGAVIDQLPMPRPANCVSRAQVSAAVVDGLVHVMGGYCWDPASPIDDWYPNDHDVFDPATGTWSSRTPWQSSSYVGAAAIGRQILAVDVGEGVHVYDVATDAWTIHRAVTEDPEYGDMPGGVAVFQNSLYMLGGGNSLPDPTCGRIAYPLHTVRRFDLAARSRDRAPSMITARTDLVAVEVDGVIFAFGGTTGWSRCTGTNGTLSSVERLIRAP